MYINVVFCYHHLVITISKALNSSLFTDMSMETCQRNLPVFYLIHPDDPLERGGLEGVVGSEEFQERMLKSETNKKILENSEYARSVMTSHSDLKDRWMDYKRIANNNGIFVPILTSAESVQFGKHRAFYRELLNGKKTMPAWDDFSNAMESDLAYVIRMFETRMLGMDEGNFYDREHIIAGAYTNDCLSLVPELLVFGIGCGRKDSGSGVYTGSSGRVKPSDIHVSKKHIFPRTDTLYMNNISELARGMGLDIPLAHYGKDIELQTEELQYK